MLSVARVLFSVLFLLVSLVQAHPNNIALEIEAIRAHFQGSGLVPSLLANFTPTALLAAAYTGVGTVTPGQLLLKSREYNIIYTVHSFIYNRARDWNCSKPYYHARSFHVLVS